MREKDVHRNSIDTERSWLPKLGAALREVEHLSRVEQPLEGLEEPAALVATALGVDKD